MDGDGKYVDGLLGFTVESVKASGHIITIEGNLLQNEGSVGQANSAGHVQTIDIAVRSIPIAPPPIPPLPVRGSREGGVSLEMLDRLQNVESKERERKKEKKDRKEGEEIERREKKKMEI